MKTLTILIALVTFSASVFANNTSVNESAKKAVKAVTHYVDDNGNEVATSRYISDAELPLSVIKKLMKKCPDQNILSVREFDAAGDKTYVVTLETGTAFQVVKVSSSTFKTLQAFNKAN
ncbi:hypothetical protein LX64_04878 [Chitinophaga skermanii]|uniref:PepSY-like beta-lactamase-inhibitor n=1 Tax=Chitinophaga skermanii TaxID=331697 RepID=A0A327Q9M7_9BACT|nr:hypothetical protein [Chitinophaga skermanii]RAI98516.1 hypothetical protein LX64_04878 [Chitinophaga skermanii]